MRLHRFLGNFDLSSRTLTVIEPEMISQWKNVLRLKTGDHVILCDGNGSEAEGIFTELTKKEARFTIENVQKMSPEPQKEVTLYAALLRRENFEIVVQKATEIGIRHIAPLLSERTVKIGFNRERLEKIIREASEQSGRTTLPILSEPMQFIEALENVKPEESALFDLSGQAMGSNLEASNLFVGPEGGFTEAEVLAARERGLVILSLGSLTLRAETAAIVVSFLGVQ